MPNISPIFANMKISGRLSPRSHLPTHCCVTFNISANCDCESPLSFRPFAIRIPMISIFIILAFCSRSRICILACICTLVVCMGICRICILGIGRFFLSPCYKFSFIYYNYLARLIQLYFVQSKMSNNRSL